MGFLKAMDSMTLSAGMIKMVGVNGDEIFVESDHINSGGVV